MSNTIVNTFEKMQDVGTADAASDNTAAREIRNMRFIHSEGGHFVLASVRGTEHRLRLPEGFQPHGHAVHGEVAYLVLFNPHTGAGELGSFPSPSSPVGEGELAYEYQPLYNLVRADGTAGPFRSARFAFRADKPVEVRVQPDYDGSVNLVLNDAHNPPRIVNTGFAVGPGGRTSHPDRAGSGETNRYTEDSFDDRLLLVQRSSQITRLEFRGVREGGRQKDGTYHYYFRYGTQDGNVTELVAESDAVMVAHGDRPSNVRGGAGDGEDTTKATHLRLSNLDQGYSRLYAFFVHTTGQTDPVRSAYRIEQPLLITGDTLDFVHTGFEDVQRIAIQELSVEAPSIARVGAIEQAQGHLFLFDIEETDRPWGELADFAHRLTAGHRALSMPVPGMNALAELAAEANRQEPLQGGAQFWNNGYANPMNTYHRRGYFGGEAYPFAIRYIFPDGAMSPAFPYVGADNVGGAVSQAMMARGGFDAQGLSPEAPMLNNRGIYRFPNRDVAGLANAGLATVLAATVGLPAKDDPMYARIREQTVGVQFLRGERKPDLLAQGLLTPTYAFPTLDMESSVESSNPDKTMWGWFNQYTGSSVQDGVFSEQYLHGDKRRVMPLVHGELEAAYFNNGDGDRYYAAFPFRVWKGYIDPTRYGLYSLDMATDHTRLAAALNNRQVSVKYLQQVTLAYEEHRYFNHSNRAIYAPSLYRLQGMGPLAAAKGPQEGTAFYAVDGQEDVLASNGLFGSYVGKATWQRAANTNDYFKAERLFFCDYLGLHLPQAAKDASMAVSLPTLGERVDGEEVFEKQAPRAATQLVNLYGQGGQRPAEAVWQVYRNIDAVRYTPISGRLSWAELEAAVDAERQLTLFGGDCFVGAGFKKIYYGKRRENPEEREADYVGRGLMLVQESPRNMYLRTEEDAGEAERRSFFPFYRSGEDRGLFFKSNKLPESKAFGQGYGKLLGDQTLLTRPVDAPFLRSRWFSRVMASAKHIPNSFENGYRYFPGLSHQDYTSEYGAITAARAKAGRLLVFFERAVALIPVNERVQTGADSAGAIFVEGGGLLPPHLGMVTEDFGSAGGEGICLTDNYAYLVVPEKGLIARMGFEGGAAELISDVLLGPFLKHYGRGLRPLAFHDPQHGEVLFAFRGEQGFTVAFHEGLSLWAGFRDFLPHTAFALASDRLFSTPWADPGQLHEHNTGGFHQFYGARCRAVVRFVANPMLPRQVSYTTQAVASSNALPAHAGYRVSGAAAQLPIVAAGDPVQDTARRLRGQTFLTLPRAQTLTAEATEPWLPAELSALEPEFGVGARLRGTQLETRLEFAGDKQILLERVITYIQ